MGTMELEAMREDDFSWHPCTVSLNSSGDGVFVEFGSKESGVFTLNKEQVIDRLRFRSIPLHGDDCSRIKEGDLVVATPTSGDDGALFFDAKVEKVLRVRHNRGPCRCIFSITWLHQNLIDATKVPSGAVMKLSMKSISIYPVISVLLEQQQEMGSISTLPSLPANEAITGETDFVKFSGRKTKGANNPSDHFKKQVSEETQLGSQEKHSSEDSDLNFPEKEKGCGCKETVKGSPNLVASTRVASPNIQVPSEQKQLKRATRSSINAKVDVEIDIDPVPTSSIMEEFSGNRLHRSPLAACAALASRVQISNSAVRNGSSMFPASVADGNFSWNISGDAVPIAAEPLRIEKPHISSPSSALCKRKFVETSFGQGTNKSNNKDENLECAYFSTEKRIVVLGIPSSICVLKETKLIHHKEARKVPIPALEPSSTVTSCDNPQMHVCNTELKVGLSCSNKRFTRSALQHEKERIAADSECKSCCPLSSETPEANIFCHSNIGGAFKQNVQRIACVSDMKLEASTNRQRFTATHEEKGILDKVVEIESSHRGESDNSPVDFSTCESSVSKKKGCDLGKKEAAYQLVEPSSGEEMEKSKYADETLECANFGIEKWKMVLGIPSQKCVLKETEKCTLSTGYLAFQETEKSESKDETLQCAKVGTESRNLVLGIPSSTCDLRERRLRSQQTVNLLVKAENDISIEEKQDVNCFPNQWIHQKLCTG